MLCYVFFFFFFFNTIYFEIQQSKVAHPHIGKKLNQYGNF